MSSRAARRFGEALVRAAVAALPPELLALVTIAAAWIARLIRAASRPTSPPPKENTMIKTFLVSAEETVIAELKAAGRFVESFVTTEGAKLLAETKQLPVGTLILNLFGVFEAQAGMSGPQRMAAVIGAVTPVLQAIKDAGGLNGLETSVADFANAFAHSAFLDFKTAAAAATAGVSPITGKPAVA